jgi:PncC family amidohydrolase
MRIFLIGHRLTQIPGSSDYFLSDIVAYSNAAKQHLLGVNAETLAAHGAVSAETAREMAEGAATEAGADCSVATTGIAGPTGGTPEKPVGTVWFGVYSPLGLEAHHRRFHGGRRFVKRRTAQHALILLRRALLKLQDKQSRA